MAILKDNEYQCAQCGGVFQKGWSDEEAKAEAVETFGVDLSSHPNGCLICDDCYTRLMGKAKRKQFLGQRLCELDFKRAGMPLAGRDKS